MVCVAEKHNSIWAFENGRLEFEPQFHPLLAVATSNKFCLISLKLSFLICKSFCLFLRTEYADVYTIPGIYSINGI